MSIRIVTSPLAPPGTIYVVDMAAFELDPVKRRPIAPRPISTFDTQYFRVGMGITMTAIGATEIERDPMEIYGLARNLRQFLRLARALFGYEYRKASGTLRRVPRARHGIITGLTA